METLIPACLRRQRNQRRLTLEMLSAKVGMSPQHLSEIESGKRDPRLSSIERMAEATRLYNGDYKLDERRKEWEFALLFVRVFRSLDSIVGNEQTARQWLNSENCGLNGRPVDLIRQTEGLVRVVHYLDASRGLV